MVMVVVRGRARARAFLFERNALTSDAVVLPASFRLQCARMAGVVQATLVGVIFEWRPLNNASGLSRNISRIVRARGVLRLGM